MGYFGPSPLECYLWSACLPETIVPRPTNLIVLIGIRLGASLPIRPDRRTSQVGKLRDSVFRKRVIKVQSVSEFAKDSTK